MATVPGPRMNPTPTVSNAETIPITICPRKVELASRSKRLCVFCLRPPTELSFRTKTWNSSMLGRRKVYVARHMELLGNCSLHVGYSSIAVNKHDGSVDPNLHHHRRQIVSSYRPLPCSPYLSLLQLILS